MQHSFHSGHSHKVMLVVDFFLEYRYILKERGDKKNNENGG